MDEGRRDLFAKLGLLGASALAFMGVSKSAKADSPAAQNPLLGLWDLTFPSAPTDIYKYAISEGAYVATGNDDATAAIYGYRYSPTMGTYARSNFHNTYRLRERGWAMNADGTPAGSTDFTGTAVVAEDGKSWSGSGTLTQYDVNGNVAFILPNFTYNAVRFAPEGAKSPLHSM